MDRAEQITVSSFVCSISHFATADEFTDTTIRVITIEKRQYGIYTCKAKNKLGSAEGIVELFGKVFDCIFIVLHDNACKVIHDCLTEGVKITIVFIIFSS